MNRRLHLSKTKHSKFNESGQLAVFYLFSFIWGCSILTAVRRLLPPGLLNPQPSLTFVLFPPPRRTLQPIPLSCGRTTLTPAWCKYALLVSPVAAWVRADSNFCPLSSFQVKFFYVCQIAYWLHALPELYFQKVRKVRRSTGGLGQRSSISFMEIELSL